MPKPGTATFAFRTQHQSHAAKYNQCNIRVASPRVNTYDLERKRKYSFREHMLVHSKLVLVTYHLVPKQAYTPLKTVMTRVADAARA